MEVDLVQKINEHYSLYVKALLPSEAEDKYVKETSEGTSIQLSAAKSDGSNQILFQGIVKDVMVYKGGGQYYLEVQAVSYSFLLDIEKKSRTFQDKDKTYEALLTETAGQAGAEVLDMVSKGGQLKQFLVQYQETDWVFYKRLASHFHAGLTNDIRFAKPKLYFGIPKLNNLKMDAQEYSVKKDSGKYLRLSENGMKGLMEQDFLYYQVECDQEANIGDTASFMGQNLFVCQINGRMEQGTYRQYLTLASKKGMSQPDLQNEKIIGASLNGSILEVENDRVKVNIQIDAVSGHQPGTPCFFPYSTIYSSKDGSGWYCMPEIGDSIRIYFPDGIEDHGYAISSVHEAADPSSKEKSAAGSSDNAAGSYSGKRDDPNVKSLRNKDGKEIRLAPEGLYILADGTLIKLIDEEGISIISDKNIEFHSEKNIILSAEENVDIIGETGIHLKCETSEIIMKDNIELVGQEVLSN